METLWKKKRDDWRLLSNSVRQWMSSWMLRSVWWRHWWSSFLSKHWRKPSDLACWWSIQTGWVQIWPLWMAELSMWSQLSSMNEWAVDWWPDEVDRWTEVCRRGDCWWTQVHWRSGRVWKRKLFRLDECFYRKICFRSSLSLQFALASSISSSRLVVSGRKPLWMELPVEGRSRNRKGQQTPGRSKLRKQIDCRSLVMSKTSQMHLRISEHSPTYPSGVRQLEKLIDCASDDEPWNEMRLSFEFPLITRCHAVCWEWKNILRSIWASLFSKTDLFTHNYVLFG